jgi:hypothetical protein
MAKKKNAGAKYFGKPLTGDPDEAPESSTEIRARPLLQERQRRQQVL